MTTTASTGDTPRVRARRALGLAVGMVAPDAIVLENGALRLGHSRERLGRKALRRLERRLERRAGIVDDDRLIAEAVAFVGAEVDRARGGNAVDGATGGLDALLDLPGLPARQRSEGNALLRDLLDGNRLETDADLRRLTRARARQESSGHPATADLVADTNALIDEAERMTTPAPAALRNPSSPRPGVGGRNNAPGNGFARAVHRLVGKSAADQAKLQDAAAAGERARRLRNRGVACLRIAERHEQIAAACTIAAERARTAAEAAQALTTGGDADIARRAIQAYERADAATVPAKDLQHNGLPSGRLPHLSALCAELNEASGEPGRFTPDALHRTLRGESRRLLSPDGLVLTPDNDPRAGVRGVPQLHLVLDPGELREVLDSPVQIDEAQVGQVVQGGFSFATAASRDVNVAAGASLATLSHALPDASQLRAAAMFVSPGAELAQGRGRTVSGGATDFAQPGAVEALRGEFLRYRADRPRWIWRIRESATADWSEPNVVDTGSDRDATALVLGFVHTYTVPPPADTTSLDALGLDAERRPTMPEHMATRVDGLHDLCDRTVAELRRTLGALDRVGHDRVRSLIVEDGMIRLDQTSRPRRSLAADHERRSAGGLGPTGNDRPAGVRRADPRQLTGPQTGDLEGQQHRRVRQPDLQLEPRARRRPGLVAPRPGLDHRGSRSRTPRRPEHQSGTTLRRPAIRVPGGAPSEWRRLSESRCSCGTGSPSIASIAPAHSLSRATATHICGWRSATRSATACPPRAKC
ncbi:hypothetical protein [Kribbella sp. NPDC048915]|uniref:hypothetical protein n=1 Tax=Kribbella sp. NPDC048915 TaxID=3155148 RepID=UPI0033E9D3B7